MKVIVISNYDVIREGIIAVLSKQKDVTVQFSGRTVEEAVFMIKADMADVILIDIHKDNEEEIKKIEEIRFSGKDIKTLFIDFYGSNQLFVRALRAGAKGYIWGKATEEEIMYALDQIYKQKKYFDSYFIDSMIAEKTYLPSSLELLTVREKEIFAEVAKGLSNRKISEKYLISEHTVKKHINHIFEKLKVKDRNEAAHYAGKYKMT